MRWIPKGKRLVEIVLAAMLLTGTMAWPHRVTLAQSAVATTQLTDTIYRADGTTATGTVLVSWPAFTTANGLTVPAGNTSVTIGAGGTFSVALAPNAGSSPMGSYYTAVYQLDDGTVSREYWVVPVSAYPVAVSSIKSTVLPASVAMQTVTKNYVDTAITAAVTGHPMDSSTPYVLKAGDTMTGALVLPGDPVATLQAADKHYVDASVAAVSSGVGGKVALNPGGSQVVTQPTGTNLSANLLNGVVYASQYVNGGGNNGISNALASPDCASGCEVKADESYTSAFEKPPYSQFASQTHFQDTRLGSQWDRFLNPESVEYPGSEIGESIDVTATRSAAAIFQATRNPEPSSTGLLVTNEGLGGGSNQLPKTIEGTTPYGKAGYSALSVKGVYNAAGQHVLAPRSTVCYGVGDCLIGSAYITASGGFRDEADEGAHPLDIQVTEDTNVFDGTCSTGCATGATQITVAVTKGGGTQGEGRFLIDMNPSKTITGGQLTGGAFGYPHAKATFTGSSFPVSTFFATGQIIPSQSNNMAPGTVTFVIATGTAPTGYATNTAAAPAGTGLACVVDEPNGANPSNYEMAPYTVVDGTHLTMTFNKVHNTLATIAIGGLCGYGLEQTVDTTNGVRQVFPVVGSYSATGLYYAGTVSAIVGLNSGTSSFTNVNLPIASLSRSGNVVSVRTASNMPFDLNGLALTVSGATDSSYNGTFPVTTTAVNTMTYVQTGANSTTSGGTISVVTGGYVLYPMAEVLSVLDASTTTVDGTMTLAPNTVPLAAGDALEQPHFYQMAVSPDITYITQVTPRPNTAVHGGLQFQGNTGPGVQGWTVTNSTPAANYYGNGGTHTAPDFAYQAAGPWQRTMLLQGGETSLFTVNCNSHGCNRWNSPFNLFELQSGVGTDTIGWAPTTSTVSLSLRGAGYSFTPSAFTAGTVNATTVNATTITGALNGSSITAGTIAAARLPLFGASGASHSAGAVPDPGATAGASRYLREDGTWVVPTGGSNGVAGAAAITSGTIADVAITSSTMDGSVIGGTTPAAGSFTSVTAQTAIAAGSGGTGSATVPAAGQMLVGNASGTAYAPQAMSGDCTVQASGAIVCTKTNGVALGSAATTAASAYDAAGTAAAVQAAGLQKANNLSDLASAATARTNLGLGSAAVQASSAFDAAGAGASAVTSALGTAPAAGQIPVGNAGGTAYAGMTIACPGGTTLTSISSGGAVCAPGVYSLPDVTHLLFDYQMKSTESANSYFTDYSAADGSAIGVGNCPFLASPDAPTWLTTTGGAAFGISGTSGGHYTGCSIPAAANGLRTYVVLLQSPTYNGAFATTPAFQTTLASNGTTSGPYLTQTPLKPSPRTYAMGVLNGGAYRTNTLDNTAGRPCMAYTLGTSGDATYDAFYINGLPVGSYTADGQTGGQQTTGNYQLGGISASGIYFLGNIYRAAAWSTYLNAGQVYQACQLLMADGNSRGVLPSVTQNTSQTNQIMGTGDSIQYGTGGTPGLPSNSELGQLSNLTSTYTVSDFGMPGSFVLDSASQAVTTVIPQCSTGAQKNIAIFEAATNDLAASGAVPASVWATNVAYASEVRAAWTKAGCSGKIGIQTLISRAQLDNGTTGGGIAGNGLRDPYNTLVRQQWKASGFDFINDVAEDTNMGVNGGNASTTYFSSDHIHPLNAGYLLMANITSRNINKAYATVDTTMPNTVTSALSPYTQLDADVSLLEDATSGNVVVSATSCIGTGVPLYYKRIDSVAANTVTINANGTDLINGASSITLAPGGSVTLLPIAKSSATAGCTWVSK